MSTTQSNGPADPTAPLLAPLGVKLEDAAKIIGLIPVFAAAVALSYEMGYFYGFDENLFSLFSISDHILFTLESLPLGLIAIPVAALAVILFSQEARARLFGSSDLEGSQKLISYGLIAMGGAALLAKGPLLADAMLYVVALDLFVLGVVFYPDAYRRSPSLFLVVLSGLFLTGAFYAGVHICRDRLVDWRKKDMQVHSIKTDDGILSGRIVTSGEKGVLFFDGASNGIAFLRWESVKAIRSTTQQTQVSARDNSAKPTGEP